MQMNERGTKNLPSSKNSIQQWSEEEVTHDNLSPKCLKVDLSAFSISNNTSTTTNEQKGQEVQDAEQKLQSIGKPQFSLAERAQLLYQSQIQIRKIVSCQSLSSAMQEGNSNYSNSQRVMFQNLFTENRKKSLAVNNNSEATNTQNKQDESNTNSKTYISTLNTRRNPDIIVPGAKFLKGNAYFKSVANQEELKEEDEKESKEEESQQEGLDMLSEGEDEYSKLINQQARYFREGNPTIKCRNCLEYGHYAKECPNQKKNPNCILCGKDSHDSFSCTEKICFKCNKVGHVAMACKEKNIIKCNRCGLNGHKETRCLKLWNGEIYTESQKYYLRCIECGKNGHVKCTKEKISRQMIIDTMVKDDLEEFRQIMISPKKKKNGAKNAREMSPSFDYYDDIENTSWIKENTNILVPENSSKKTSYSSVYRQAQQAYGVPKNHKSSDIYCCYCGERHSEENCYYKTSRPGNLKFQQFEKVRQRLNDINSYDREDSYYYKNDSQYNQRVAQDPRRTKLSSSNVQRNSHYYERDSDSSSSSERGNYKRSKQRNYRESSSSQEIQEYEAFSNDNVSDDSDEILTSFNDVLTKNKNQNQQKFETETSKFGKDQQRGGNKHRQITNSSQRQNQRYNRQPWLNNQNNNYRSRSRDYQKNQNYNKSYKNNYKYRY